MKYEVKYTTQFKKDLKRAKPVLTPFLVYFLLWLCGFCCHETIYQIFEFRAMKTKIKHFVPLAVFNNMVYPLLVVNARC